MAEIGNNLNDERQVYRQKKCANDNKLISARRYMRQISVSRFLKSQRKKPRRLGLFQFNHHPGRDAHGHEFLEQKLASVRNANFGDLSFVATAFAFEGVVSQVGDRHETAKIANVYCVSVGDFE